MATNSDSASPLLGISMSTLLQPSQTDGMDHEQLMERLDALITQEASYSCQDYLSRQHRKAQEDRARQGKTPVDEEDPNLVDASCREKMCEWSYRVCDHFKVPRNIVAIAFSFLDRFVDKCTCDRTAFKLTSMTALYVATKLFNGRQLSITTLAELSRGEFQASHISDMETIMLKTLDWKLNPPVIQDFIQYFMALLPPNFPQRQVVAQRAMFFAELCVYDYDLILHDRGVVALSAIFNAIDAVLGMDDPGLANELENMLLDGIKFRYPSCCLSSAFDRVQQPSVLVATTQRRLWYLYSCSSQAVQDKAMGTAKNPTKLRRPTHYIETAPDSPTGVHQVTSIEDTTTRC